MKKITFYLLAVLTALSLVVVSCEKDGGSDDSSISKITMVVQSAEEVRIKVTATATVTIDWGDGTIQEYGLVALSDYITHSYSAKANYTIVIVGEDITELDCHGNHLTSLDVSYCTALTILYCYNNYLTAVALNTLFATLHSTVIVGKVIWIGGNPGTATCDQSILTGNGWTACTDCKGDGSGDDGSSTSKITMTVHSNAVAGMMVASGDVLGSVTISWGDGTTQNYTCLELIELIEDEDAITHSYPSTADYTITITGKDIIVISCRNNQLISLDVSLCPELTALYCDENQLTTLDVGKNTELIGLSCGSNQLTTLDVSKNTAIESLSCYNNQLSASALNTLFGTLHSNAGTTTAGKHILIDGNPGTSTCDRSIATNKGWMVLD